jgi:hypothetical protein
MVGRPVIFPGDHLVANRILPCLQVYPSHHRTASEEGASKTSDLSPAELLFRAERQGFAFARWPADAFVIKRSMERDAERDTRRVGDESLDHTGSLCLRQFARRAPGVPGYVNK